MGHRELVLRARRNRLIKKSFYGSQVKEVNVWSYFVGRKVVICGACEPGTTALPAYRGLKVMVCGGEANRE